MEGSESRHEKKGAVELSITAPNHKSKERLEGKISTIRSSRGKERKKNMRSRYSEKKRKKQKKSST